MEKAKYGLDAPYVVATFIGIALVSPFLGLWLESFLQAAGFPLFAIIIKWEFWCISLIFLLETLCMIHSSKKGKKKCLSRLLDKLSLQGNEKVLDVGCGRGLFSTLLAKRLPSGRVTGIDIWQGKDQSGNSLLRAQKNALLEGVENRVEFQTADMRKIPFPDDSFDLVVSSLVIHNLSLKEDRLLALSEMARVLKPSGMLVIVDFRNTSEYVQALESLGWKDIQLTKRSFQIFPPVRVVVGKKAIKIFSH